MDVGLDPAPPWLARALNLASSTAAELIGTASPEVHIQAWKLARGMVEEA